MPLSYSIDKKLGIVRVTAEGSPTVREQAQLAGRWLKDPDYRPGMPILLDNRLRSEPSNRQEIAEVVSEARRSTVLAKGTRCAVLVTSDAEFGMTRMFASMSDDEPLITKPFRDMQSAERWLVSGDD